MAGWQNPNIPVVLVQHELPFTTGAKSWPSPDLLMRVRGVPSRGLVPGASQAEVTRDTRRGGAMLETGPNTQRWKGGGRVK